MNCFSFGSFKGKPRLANLGSQIWTKPCGNLVSIHDWIIYLRLCPSTSICYHSRHKIWKFMFHLTPRTWWPHSSWARGSGPWRGWSCSAAATGCGGWCHALWSGPRHWQWGSRCDQTLWLVTDLTRLGLLPEHDDRGRVSAILPAQHRIATSHRGEELQAAPAASGGIRD